MRDAIDAQEWDNIYPHPECTIGRDCEFDNFTHYEHPLIHYLIEKGLLTHEGEGELWGESFTAEDEEIAERLAGTRIEGKDWLMAIFHHPSPVLLRYLYDHGRIKLHSEESAQLMCSMARRVDAPHISRPVLDFLAERGEHMDLQAHTTRQTPLFTMLYSIHYKHMEDVETPFFEEYLGDIEWLLEHGADPCLPVYSGETPISFAMKLPERHYRLLDLLYRYA